VFVVFVQCAVDHRHWSGHVHFYRLGCLGFGEPEIFDDRGGASADLPDDAGNRTRLFAAAVNLLDGFMCQINAIKCRKNMVDEPGTPLLTVGEKIEPDPFLSVDAQRRGVVLGFFEHRALEAKKRTTSISLRQPARSWKAADRGCRDRRKFHDLTPSVLFRLYPPARGKTSLSVDCVKNRAGLSHAAHRVVDRRAVSD